MQIFHCLKKAKEENRMSREITDKDGNYIGQAVHLGDWQVDNDGSVADFGTKEEAIGAFMKIAKGESPIFDEKVGTEISIAGLEEQVKSLDVGKPVAFWRIKGGKDREVGVLVKCSAREFFFEA
jgi:hypothetical protein